MALAVAYKRLEDIVNDIGFWESVKVRVYPEVLELFTALYVGGMTAGHMLAAEQQRGQKQDVDINDLGYGAGQDILMATDQWWLQFESATQSQMRDIFQAARITGEQPRETAARLTGLFSPARAQTIAITESTKLFGAGALATYRNLGYTQWEWTTVEDPAVESICSSLSGSIHSVNEPFYPAHPRCRCFPVSVPSTQTATAPPAATVTRPDIAAFHRRLDRINSKQAFMRALNSRYPDKRFHFRSIKDMDSLKASMKQLTKLIDEFPEASRSLRLITDIPHPGVGPRPNTLAYVASSPTRAQALAGESMMYLNPAQDYFGSFLYGSAKRREMVNYGWSPAGTDAIESTVTHEFGHVIHRSRTGWTDQPATDATRTIDQLNDTADINAFWSGANGLKPRRLQVSEYAADNEREFFAEAFLSWYQDAPIRSAAGQEIKQQMGDLINKIGR